MGRLGKFCNRETEHAHSALPSSSLSAWNADRMEPSRHVGSRGDTEDDSGAENEAEREQPGILVTWSHPQTWAADLQIWESKRHTNLFRSLGLDL